MGGGEEEVNDVLPGLHDVEMILEPYRLSSSFATRIFPILLCRATSAMGNRKRQPWRTCPYSAQLLSLGAPSGLRLSPSTP